MPVASFLAFVAMAPTSGGPTEPLFSGLGDHSWKVSTHSRLAQRYFDQGFAFMNGFNHDEAIRSFKQAAQIDPHLAIAYWGVALANGPNINNTFVDPAHAKAAYDALGQAQTLKPHASPLERDLIQALARRYANPQPQDRSKLDRAYADAMRQVWHHYSNNPDVGALFAESLMDLRPWDLWKQDGSPQPGTPELMTTLKRVLKLDPMIPQGNHLTVHATEGSPHPEDGLPSAYRLETLQPGLGHMVHMPSHTYVRTGQWQRAIDSNENAIVVDANYRKKSPRQGFYAFYMSHNRDMLSYAAMMCGQKTKALKASRSMIAIVPPEFLPTADGMTEAPMEVMKRFGMWKEVLAEPDFPKTMPISRAMRHAARGVAYAALGQMKEATAEQTAFEAIAKGPINSQAPFQNTTHDILALDGLLLNGELLVQEGKSDDGIAELNKAVAKEDSLRYNEPPDWRLPARHSLGAALVKQGKYQEALAVYNDDLKKIPGDGWALYGRLSCLTHLGRNKEAARAKAQYAKVWRNADTQITTSCLCLPK